MEYTFYKVEKKESIAWVYLNRSEKKNAMNAPAWKELIPIMQDLDGDGNIRVIIIAGKGTMFCAGIDLMGMISELPELLEKEQKGGTKLSLYQKILGMQDGLSCIEWCSKPVIAAVHGKCIGAGLDMITACDIRLCSEDAEFSLREAAVGITADMGVLQRISNICGQGIARELAFTACDINAARAKEIHLVNQVFTDHDELMTGAERFAMDIAANSPLAVRGAKAVLKQMFASRVGESLVFNAAMSAVVIPSNDLMEAVAAFTQKRKPNFTGS
ncbi:MAG: crotonase/enoyl-CoA hydratase family protein [Spirochaetes bacterium]|nr:crotonase/enoyl-CoA hydratase family protein [Spirochaetota bacterium]